MERAQTLMAYEKQMPALLAEPERARSEKIIFWSWRAQSAVAIALILTFRLLGYSDGWYALVHHRPRDRLGHCRHSCR